MDESVFEDDAWAEVDRVTASWANPAEGDVSAELWTYRNGGGPTDPYYYTLLPLHGDWRKMVEEYPEQWTLALRSAGLHVDTFAVNVYEDGMWHRRVLWNREAGVRWLS